MKFTFNERSAIPVASVAHAYAVWDQFFDVCKYLTTKYNHPLGLYYTEAPQHLLLHADASFLAYINTIDNEKRTFILGLLTGKPVVHDYPYYIIDKKACNGIGHACEMAHPALSMATANQWTQNFINLFRVLISDAGEESEDIKHKNVFDNASVDFHDDEIKKIIKAEVDAINSGINSGKEIWEAREKIFPHIVFSAQTKEYLVNLSGGGIFHALFKRLREINSYFKNWKTGDFDRKGFSGESRLESDTRIDKYGFNFPFPDKKTYFCGMHCEYYDHGFRLHFFPRPADHICYIGYIGKKIGS